MQSSKVVCHVECDNDYDTCSSEDCESNDVVYEFEEQFRNDDLPHSESEDGGSDSGYFYISLSWYQPNLEQEYDQNVCHDGRRDRADSFNNDNEIALDGYDVRFCRARFSNFKLKLN